MSTPRPGTTPWSSLHITLAPRPVQLKTAQIGPPSTSSPFWTAAARLVKRSSGPCWKITPASFSSLTRSSMYGSQCATTVSKYQTPWTPSGTLASSSGCFSGTCAASNLSKLSSGTLAQDGISSMSAAVFKIRLGNSSMSAAREPPARFSS
eukprot:scaffold7932_cov410-Pinguiococcus_pyrenoidosus.AAC.2